MSRTSPAPAPAVVVVAHNGPRQLRRLVDALSPWPIFLHVDANTDDATFSAMTDQLPDNVVLLPRLRAGWARYEVFGAELEGYRQALRTTQARHIVNLTGADYPLASRARIIEVLDHHPDQSFAKIDPLPIEGWGIGRGYDRFWFPQRSWRKQRLLLPLPRRIPRGITPGGGSQMKILTRRHASLVVDVLDNRPGLLQFFRNCWTPDEVIIPSLMLSEELGANWSRESAGFHPWYIDWGPGRPKSPRWLTATDLPLMFAAASRPDTPALFARKFDDNSSALTHAIDVELRNEVVER